MIDRDDVSGAFAGARVRYPHDVRFNEPLSAASKSRSQFSGMNELSGELLERRHLLEIEIQKRRRALDENVRLRREIERLTQAANIGAREFALAKNKFKEHLANQAKFLDSARIIRPLDAAAVQQQLLMTSQQQLGGRFAQQQQLQLQGQSNRAYSSSDYYFAQRAAGGSVSNVGYSDCDALPPRPPPYTPFDSIAPRDELSYFEQQLGLRPSAHSVYDVTPRADVIDFGANKSMYMNSSVDNQSDASITTDTSVKDSTPSMPILDDVTMRSRTKLRQIGSRPLSDDFGEFTQHLNPGETLAFPI